MTLLRMTSLASLLFLLSALGRAGAARETGTARGDFTPEDSSAPVPIQDDTLYPHDSEGTRGYFLTRP